jgi:uncharacterized small protein (DUF1192 family)
MAYTIAELDNTIATLEAGLAKSYAEVTHEGNRLVYTSTKEIRERIAYFKALYDNATDAPANPAPKIRTFFLHGGNRGIGF